MLKSLLALNDTHSGMLFNALETAMVTTVGSLLSAAESIAVQDVSYQAIGKLNAISSSFLQDIAGLRDKVKGGLPAPLAGAVAQD